MNKGGFIHPSRRWLKRSEGQLGYRRNRLLWEMSVAAHTLTHRGTNAHRYSKTHTHTHTHTHTDIYTHNHTHTRTHIALLLSDRRKHLLCGPSEYHGPDIVGPRGSDRCTLTYATPQCKQDFYRHVYERVVHPVWAVGPPLPGRRWLRRDGPGSGHPERGSPSVCLSGGPGCSL